MELFAYSFGLSLGPTLIGFILGLGFVKYAYKTTLIKQAKWIAYLSAVLISAIVISIAYPITDSANVVIGTTIGFVMTLLVGRLLRKKTNSDEEQQN